jgi:hypothetical protein
VEGAMNVVLCFYIFFSIIFENKIVFTAVLLVVKSGFLNCPNFLCAGGTPNMSNIRALACGIIG